MSDAKRLEIARALDNAVDALNEADKACKKLYKVLDDAREVHAKSYKALNEARKVYDESCRVMIEASMARNEAGEALEDYDGQPAKERGEL